MPTIKELYKSLTSKLEELKANAVKMTDPKLNPTVAYDNTVARCRAVYAEQQLEQLLAKALSTLPEEELRAYYKKVKTNQGNKQFTEDRFVENAKKASPLGILNGILWGRSVDEILDQMDDLFKDKPEIVNGIAKATDMSRVPDEEGYDGPLDAEPYAGRIGELKQQYPSEADQQILDEAAEYLKNTDPQVMASLQRYQDSAGGYGDPSMMQVLDAYSGLYAREGFKTLANGSFSETLKPLEMRSGAPSYLVNEKKYRG